jgi:hypothetical protein
MSKVHKSSKRKDLAFVTFETHQEAKNAVDSYKMKYGEGDSKEEDLNRLKDEYSHVFDTINADENYQVKIEGNENYTYPKYSQSQLLYNPLGPNVSISLAFSQQAMQAKKKIKESRKKGTTHAGQSSPPTQKTPNIISSNINTISTVNSNQIIPQPQVSTINNQQIQTGSQQNINAAAMLAMVNLINMNKVKSIK